MFITHTMLSFLLIVWFSALTISVIQLWIELKAMKASTHKVEFINPLGDLGEMKDEFQAITEDIKKQFNVNGGEL